MQVAVCYGPKDIRFEEIEIPPLDKEDVLVKVAYCGICPSDLRIYQGQSSMTLPAVLGHEFTGWIEAVGEKVSDLKTGTKVVVDPVKKCYTRCQACKHGYYNKCVNMADAFNGFAQYHVTRAANVHPLHDSTDLAAAALTEPLACVLHGQSRAKVVAGAVIVIIGVGPIGLLHLQAAKLAGARVIVSDLSTKRLEQAFKLGADYAIQPEKQNIKRIVLEASDGWGADSVIIAAKAPRALQDSINLLAIGGTLVIFAGISAKDPISFDPNRVHYDEINITGSSDYNDLDFIKALKFIENGYIETKKLISDIVPFKKISEGMDLVSAGNKLKILVNIGAD